MRERVADPPGVAMLDTHAVLWALTDPARLGQTARAVVEDPATRLVVSSATAWELATEHRLGRLPRADALLAAYGRHLIRLGALESAMTAEHALLAGRLDWAHRDPFDRMLAAQCILESIPLVTRDRAFADEARIGVLW